MSFDSSRISQKQNDWGVLCLPHHLPRPQHNVFRFMHVATCVNMVPLLTPHSILEKVLYMLHAGMLTCVVSVGILTTTRLSSRGTRGSGTRRRSWGRCTEPVLPVTQPGCQPHQVRGPTSGTCHQAAGRREDLTALQAPAKAAGVAAATLQPTHRPLRPVDAAPPPPQV